jgi:hypothetical protein
MTRQEKQVVMSKDKFITSVSTIDSELKQRTLGLVQLQDFQKIKEELETRERQGEAGREAGVAAVAARQAHAVAKAKAKQQKARIEAKKLSFSMDDGHDDAEACSSEDDARARAPVAKKRAVSAKSDLTTDKPAIGMCILACAAHAACPGDETSGEREGCTTLPPCPHAFPC